ncbi:hypothetical protein [Neobacillus sp. D3-1R]|uniref:hypothetical protein n=1 Tax=Neobacillus sp. D3-1R TaxID=3445778 RepID=UPI003F9F77AC
MRTNEKEELGLGISSILMISRWMSANAMFTASLVTMTYGILAGVLYGITGAFAFSLFGVIGKRLQRKGSVEVPIPLWKGKVGEKTIKTFFLLIGVGYVFDFLLLAIGSSIIFYAVFHLPAKMGVFLFMLISVPFLFFRRLRNIRRYTIYKFGLFQAVIIIVFVYLFLSKNLEQMYFGMRLYHPYLFSIQLKELSLLVLSVFLIFLGKLVTDPGSWSLLFRIKKEKVRRSLLFTGFIWATIPVTFSIIIFPVLGLGGFHSLRTVFYDLLHLFDSSILLMITSATLLGTLISTYFVRIQDFFILFETERFSKKKKSFSFIIISIIGTLYLAYFFIQPSILELFFFIGILYSALLLPVLSVLYLKTIHNQVVVVASVISLGMGYGSMMFLDRLLSVVVAFITSAFILSLYLFFRKKEETPV